MIIQYSLDNVSGLSRLRIQFISQTNDNDNEYLVEFDISCGITEAKNMKTVFF